MSYDLGNRPAKGVTMSRGKPIQEGVRVKLSKGMTWERLATMSPDEIREKDVFPAGFFPLPFPNHPEGGMLFPKFHIDEIKKQEGRDLTRFDLDYDLPDHFLPEFPAPYYTDNLMHNLKTERFYKTRMINGRMASADGPIKTFPLRGIKDSPPYLHDDRLLTLEDTVEFFNLILELKLNDQEKKDLVAFMRAL